MGLLTLEERKKIEEGLKLGMGVGGIARKLNRTTATIRREIQRFEEGSYIAEEAHKKSSEGSRTKGNKTKLYLERFEKVEEKLEQILEFIKQNRG